MDAGVAVYLVYFGVSHVLNNYIPHMFFQCFSTLPPKCCQVSGHELFNGSNFGTMGLAGLRVYVTFFFVKSCRIEKANCKRYINKHLITCHKKMYKSAPYDALKFDKRSLTSSR